MISDALATACPHLLMITCFLYESEEMQSGINQEALTKWAPTLLKHLILLDDRGGIFSQSDVHDAMKKLADMEIYKPHVEKAAAERKISVNT